jgi:cell division protein FtsZ
VADADDGLYLEAAPATSEPVIQPPRYAQDRQPEAAPTDEYEQDHHAEPRKGGWLSLFGGRPRYDAPTSASRLPGPPPPQAPAPRPVAQRGGGAQAIAQAPAELSDANEDLDIPSFLRRLAN